MIETLQLISNRLTIAGINYEFGQWSSEVVYPYFVGEYSENTIENEDSMQESRFVLNGFSRGSWLDLETAKATIENLFSYCTQILDSGNAVDISYDSSLVIPTGDEELKRVQINLKIKEWKVSIYG